MLTRDGQCNSELFNRNLPKPLKNNFWPLCKYRTAQSLGNRVIDFNCFLQGLYKTQTTFIKNYEDDYMHVHSHSRQQIKTIYKNVVLTICYLKFHHIKDRAKEFFFHNWCRSWNFHNRWLYEVPFWFNGRSSKENSPSLYTLDQIILLELHVLHKVIHQFICYQ